MNLFRNKKKYRDYEINPDEIFLDKLNLSNLDTQQFEGVIEKRINHRSMRWFFIVLSFLALIFLGQLIRLQLVKGEAYAQISEENRLARTPLFAERGLILDRNGVELAWNEERMDAQTNEPFPYLFRRYINDGGYGHLLGYVNYPQKDDNENYWREYVIGQDGLEKKYQDSLAGQNGARLYEVDAVQKLVSEQPLSKPEAGQNLVTTIDTRLQTDVFENLEAAALEYGFQGAGSAFIDIENGDLVSFVSYPEYDPYTLSEGDDEEAIQSFFNDEGKPFLNRVLQGLYSPGSTVKPFLAIAALQEGLITDQTTMMSTGRIEIPNVYNPGNVSVFRDWRREGHGLTDVYHAIADSVNTFFYAIGGGYQQQQGLGIDTIERYIASFGISQETGILFGSEVEGTIPTPDWKEANFNDGTWRLGDTYNTSIGQFGFQVTPLQMARSMSALANNGTLVQPKLLKDAPAEMQPVGEAILPEHYATIQKALRQTVTDGTAARLNFDFIDVAAKTGTAQVGLDNEFYNSWVVGFFPYENPKYAFSVVMERAPNTEDNNGSAVRALSQAFLQIQEDHPEFFSELLQNTES